MLLVKPPRELCTGKHISLPLEIERFTSSALSAPLIVKDVFFCVTWKTFYHIEDDEGLVIWTRVNESATKLTFALSL